MIFLSAKLQLKLLTACWRKIRPLSIRQTLYGQTSTDDDSEVALTGVADTVQILECSV